MRSEDGYIHSPNQEQPRPIDQIMRQNWLTGKPNSLSAILVALCTLTLIFTSQFYWSNWMSAQDWMPATGELVFQKSQYWRAWTTVFVHGDFKHLLSNSFFFFIFGFFIHGYFGLWAFPIFAVLFGGAINLIVLSMMSPSTQLIGASGVVFWMGGFWIILSFLIDRRRGMMHRLLKTIGISLVLFFPSEAFNPAISYKAHFAGFILGVLSGLLTYFIFKKIFVSKDLFEIIIEDDFSGDAEAINKIT